MQFGFLPLNHLNARCVSHNFLHAPFLNAGEKKGTRSKKKTNTSLSCLPSSYSVQFVHPLMLFVRGCHCFVASLEEGGSVVSEQRELRIRGTSVSKMVRVRSGGNMKNRTCFWEPINSLN